MLTIAKLKRWSINYDIDTVDTAERAPTPTQHQSPHTATPHKHAAQRCPTEENSSAER
jgi:hypothetical protein